MFSLIPFQSRLIAVQLTIFNIYTTKALCRSPELDSPCIHCKTAQLRVENLYSKLKRLTEYYEVQSVTQNKILNFLMILEQLPCFDVAIYLFHISASDFPREVQKSKWGFIYISNSNQF